jgi:hypothetical protein
MKTWVGVYSINTTAKMVSLVIPRLSFTHLLLIFWLVIMLWIDKIMNI